jgi:hypothetical protein
LNLELSPCWGSVFGDPLLLRFRQEESGIGEFVEFVERLSMALCESNMFLVEENGQLFV